MEAERVAYDVIIVGAGSSGCALAARLSEDAGRDVLLLEAGPDYADLEAFPAELSRARSMAAAFPGHPASWNFVGELTPGRPYPLARGRVVGGSSTVNGTYFIRGRPEDFDGWAALGNDRWSYDQVLPAFVRSEDDRDFAGSGHGRSGPVPVVRPRPDQLRPVSRAFVEACRAAGYPEDADKNAPGVEGVGPIPRNCVDGIRMNAAITYLTGARERPNLAVHGDTLVRRVLFDGPRAVGVDAVRDGRTVTYSAPEVVLCAGGIKSPHLLMLSGIGPAAHLREHGIEVVRDSPGVGQGAKDHPSVQVDFRVRDDGDPLPDNFMAFQTCLNHTAPESDVTGDLQITCGAASYRKLFGAMTTTGGRRARIPSYLKRPLATLRALRRLPVRLVAAQAAAQDNLMLLCSLDAERSSGEIVLRSADPAQAPGIELRYLTDPADLPRMVANVRVAVELLRDPGFARIGLERIQPSDAALGSDEALAEWIRANLSTSLHTSCTARMGPASDPLAVVDQHGRVHGVEGLRVADISISPTIVRRGPAATAVMIGERMAELMDDER